MANKSLLLLAIALFGTSSALRCSDHLLSLKADDFNAEDGAAYGEFLCYECFHETLKV